MPRAVLSASVRVASSPDKPRETMVSNNWKHSMISLTWAMYSVMAVPVVQSLYTLPRGKHALIPPRI